MTNISQLDARSDANQTDDFIKTRSYHELDDLLGLPEPINVYIYGVTGLGKSSAVINIGKKINKPVVRVNISDSTTVEDLIGGWTLENGDTIFKEGPVIQAMRAGCILLLDEVDAGSHKVILELQSVAERKGYLIKKTNTMVNPSEGFQIIATGNSKGKGDMYGGHVGVRPINKAFLDRFTVHIEYKYPTIKEMKSILSSEGEGVSDGVARAISEWTDKIFSGYKTANAFDDFISVRRAIEITKMARAKSVDNPADSDMQVVLRYTTNIFEESFRDSIVSMWKVLVGDGSKYMESSKSTTSVDFNGDQNSIRYELDEKGEKIAF